MARAGKRESREFVVAVLAVGITTSVVLITTAILIDALFSDHPGISDNATRILLTCFGGMIGVIGSYVGFKAGASGVRQAFTSDDNNTDDETK